MISESKFFGVEGRNLREVDAGEIKRVWLKFYDKGVPDTIDYPVMPAYRILEDAASRYGDKVAVNFYGAKYTYRQLNDAADKVAAFLFSIGVGKGDRVIAALPNTPHYIAVAYGVFKTGAMLVQCNPIYTERELRYIVRNSEATKIFAIDVMWNNLRPLVEDGMFDTVVICKTEDYLKFPVKQIYTRFVKRRRYGNIKIEKRSEIKYYSDIMKIRGSDQRAKIDPKEDVAVIQYTGGTTGFPKGAMLTHYNVVANAYQVARWDPKASERDIFMILLPAFHVYGFTSLNAALLVGGLIILIPDPRDIKGVIKQIHRNRVTTFFGVPTLFISMLNHPAIKKYDLRSVRVCVSGAAPLPMEVKKRWEEITGGKLVEGYGLSETSPVTHVNPLYGLNKPGSIGIPVSDTYAVVVDNDGNILPPGEIGELAIFGPQVMKGYWNMEAETKKALINGWVLTGDMAIVDEDGFFYIVDRKKDLIVAGGYTIYPREVEEVLYEHPAVLEAAVVGVPDPISGEAVKAFVAIKPEYRGKITASELEKFCRERLEAYKVPRIYEFRDELPKTMVGKVLRRVLREEEMRK